MEIKQYALMCIEYIFPCFCFLSMIKYGDIEQESGHYAKLHIMSPKCDLRGHNAHWIMEQILLVQNLLIENKLTQGTW